LPVARWWPDLLGLRTLADSPELKAACEQTRQRTIEGTEPPLSKDARLLNRYRSQHARKYQWCLNELKRRRNERERRGRLIASVQRPLRQYGFVLCQSVLMALWACRAAVPAL
jgi:hypothetical protein